MLRTFSRLTLAGFVVALLAACATTGSSQPQAARHALSAVSYEVDTAHVNYVETVARQRGVRVHWVNLPMRAIPAGP